MLVVGRLVVGILGRLVVGRLAVGMLVVGILAVGIIVVGILDVRRLFVRRLATGRLVVGILVVRTLVVGRLDVGLPSSIIPVDVSSSSAPSRIVQLCGGGSVWGQPAQGRFPDADGDGVLSGITPPIGSFPTCPGLPPSLETRSPAGRGVC